MTNQYEKLDLLAIAGGEAVKQVDFRLAEAIENCLDPNTAPDAVRKITLTLVLKPSADREKAELIYKVETRFPGDAPGMDMVAISRNKKQGYVPAGRQMDIEELLADDEHGPAGEIVNLETGETT